MYQPVTAITSEASRTHDALERELRLPGGASVSAKAAALLLKIEQGDIRGLTAWRAQR